MGISGAGGAVFSVLINDQKEMHCILLLICMQWDGWTPGRSSWRLLCWQSWPGKVPLCEWTSSTEVSAGTVSCFCSYLFLCFILVAILFCFSFRSTVCCFFSFQGKLWFLLVCLWFVFFVTLSLLYILPHYQVWEALLYNIILTYQKKIWEV